MQSLTIESTENKQIIDITQHVNDLISHDSGLCNIFLRHTTAALTTADLDPGTDEDYISFMKAVTPDLPYKHAHNPKHVPDHIWASILGPSLSIPIFEQSLLLGAWQKIVVVEFDGPRKRTVYVKQIKG